MGLPVELTAAKLVEIAANAYAAGKSGIALPHLNAAVERIDATTSPHDARRLLTAQGVLLCDTGRWTEAEIALERAKQVSLDSGDEAGFFRAQSGLISAAFIRGEFQRVLNLTESERLPIPSSPDISAARCAYLLNRASAAIGLRIGSIAIAAATEAIELCLETGANRNILHQAIGRHMLVKGLLLAKDVTRAEAVLAASTPAGDHEPRAKIQLLLAEGAIAIRRFDWIRAQEIIDWVLSTCTAAASKRDALLLKLDLQEAANDMEGLMDTLGTLADEVVEHRRSVFKDTLSIHELVAPVLHNLQGYESHRPPEELAEELIRILNGSESAADHDQRYRISGLSGKFAGHLGFGTPYCRQIESAALLRDLGHFTTIAWNEAPGRRSSNVLIHYEVASSLKLLRECGFHEQTLEYKCAKQRFERLDGGGLHALKGNEFCREAQIVSICQHYVSELARSENSEPAHHSFLARVVYSSGRWYSAEITAQFIAFIEPLWQQQYLIKEGLSSTSKSLTRARHE